jgi:hypothetical protein
MKKNFKWITMFLCFVVFFSVGLVKAKPKIVTVELTQDNSVPIINGQDGVPMVLPVFIRNKRLMIEIRFISETFGVNIDLKWEEKIIKFGTNATKIELQINNPIAKINGKEVPIDSPAIIVSGRSVVPIRFIMEAFGSTVTWDPDLHKATIVYELPEE